MVRVRLCWPMWDSAETINKHGVNKTMKTTEMTFNNLSREQLEAEIRRCNDIMLNDGKRIGQLEERIRAQTETLHADAAVIAQHAIKLKEIDRLTCNCPCMSVEAQQQFERNKDANAYKCELAGVILKIRAISRSK